VLRRGRRDLWIALTAPARWVRSHFGLGMAGPALRWRFGGRFWFRRRPPVAGVREPRRPRPVLPSAAVALAEPRTDLRQKVRQLFLHD
jgi:hypothetical protein